MKVISGTVESKKNKNSANAISRRFSYLQIEQKVDPCPVTYF